MSHVGHEWVRIHETAHSSSVPYLKWECNKCRATVIGFSFPQKEKRISPGPEKKFTYTNRMVVENKEDDGYSCEEFQVFGVLHA